MLLIMLSFSVTSGLGKWNHASAKSNIIIKLDPDTLMPEL